MTATKYNEIFNQSPIAIEWYDRAGFLISVNNACLKLFGVVNQREITKFNLFKDPNIARDIKIKLLDGETVKFESEFSFEEVKRLKLYRTTCSGKKILDWSITPMKIDNVVVGYIEQIQDITERRQLRKALIETERLSAIGEMSSGVAHDFNNSLQIIIGNLEMILYDSGISQEVIDLIEVAKKSANDAASRVRQLQHFAQAKKEVKYNPINLNTLLDHAITQSKPLWKDEAQKKGLRISFQKIYGKITTVNGEEGELSSALYNIIKNAIEAMPSGGEIVVETGIVDKNVFVRLSDNGMGMSEDTKIRIFQPFFSTKGFNLGKGLGMSGVYSIIRDHGGLVAVINTELGKGTTIEILLPMGEKDKEQAKKVFFGSSNLTSARVLWVDDEEPIREVEKMFMNRLGHFANFASSGIEAIEILKNNQYDLLITDIGMPEMSGWQLVEAINGLYPKMKIAIVSGWGADIVNEEKAKHDIDYVLGKPISIREIEHVIRDVLQARI